MKSLSKVVFCVSAILIRSHLDAQPLRTATATAVTYNGFVVGVTVNDGGAGYTFPPNVTFNGVGSGAGAYSVIASGAVTQIVVTNAGSGYTSVPVVVITAPSTSLYSLRSGNAYVTIPDSPSLDSTTNQLTVECWFNRVSTAGSDPWNSAVSKDEDDYGFSGYDLRFNGSILVGSIQTSPSVGLEGGVPTGNVNPSYPGWHHYAMQYNSGTNFSLWIDGGRIFSTNFVSQLVLSSNPVTIGRQNADLRSFDGYIAEVRISKSIRYTNNFYPQLRFTSDTNTIALYHFDEGSGSIAYDSSGNGNNGTVQGNSAWSTNVPSISPVTVNLHKAVYVDFSNLSVGITYQLQTTTNLYGGAWNNYGPSFIATNAFMAFSNYWNVSDWNQLYFRLTQ
jgi:hypothetical protein